MEQTLYGMITGLEIRPSRIFFGTAVPPLLNGEDADCLLDGVAAQGINAFDCARSYGKAEEVLGDWIRRRGNREHIIILSKCGDIRNGIVKVNRQVIEEQLATSLKTLKTDYIDLYLLHRDDPDTQVGEFIHTLNEIKQAGKIRLFGVSNWTAERIREANQYAKEKGLEGFSVSSPNYGLARQMSDLWGGGCVTLSGPEHRTDREWYAETGMPVIAYSSLGRGFFSGKFRSDEPEKAKEILDEYAQKGYMYPENFLRLRAAEAMAAEKQVTVPEIAMRYIFSGRMNVFAVVGTTKAERLTASIRAAANPLSEAEAEKLTKDI